DMAHKLSREGDFLFGVGGVVTFKNAGLDKVVAELPLEWLLVETDCPYLTPVPHRGKRNESAYVEYVVRKIADLKGVAPAQVDSLTTVSARQLFGL
ncbi:MAG: TatD family hydrolase, partial [Alistipes sp.]|nr:TatD family hydrolase [Alistipes sp.]